MASPTGTSAVVALKPARTAPNFNVKHGIRFSCRQGATPAGEDAIAPMPLATPVHIGTIPKGSVITNVDVHVRTLFNGTTPALTIGSSTTADSVLTAAASAVGTAAFKSDLVTGTAVGYVPAELALFATLTGVGNNAGEIHVVIEYYPASN